jgi:hypothetical protein
MEKTSMIMMIILVMIITITIKRIGMHDGEK